MANGQPDPKPSVNPNDIEAFAPTLQPVPKTTPSGSSPTTGPPMTTAAKGVWFMRPVPLKPVGVGTSAATDYYASTPENPLVNTWYDKSDVQGQFASMSFTDQMLAEAVAKSISNRKTGGGVFTDMVDKSAYLSTVGIKKTPQQLIHELAAERGVVRADGTFDIPGKAGSTSGGGGSGGGPTSNTTTQVSTHLANPLTAEGLVDNALTTYLGREANTQEKTAFFTALQAAQKAQPSITVQHTASSGGKASTTQMSSTTQDPIDTQQFATNWAQMQKGSSEHMAATTYMDAFMSALQNPADVVK